MTTVSHRIHSMTLEKAQTYLTKGGLPCTTTPFDPDTYLVASFARANEQKSWVVFILANPITTFCYAVENYLGSPITYPTNAWGQEAVSSTGL